MNPYFVKCAIVGLLTTLATVILAAPLDGLAVLIGSFTIIFDFLATSLLVRFILNARPPGEAPKTGTKILISFVFFVKILVVCAVLAVACYFLNPIFVVLGLMALVVGVTWQTLAALRNQQLLQGQ